MSGWARHLKNGATTAVSHPPTAWFGERSDELSLLLRIQGFAGDYRSIRNVPIRKYEVSALASSRLVAQLLRPSP